MNSLELSRREERLLRKRKPTSRKTETLVRYEFDPNNPPPLTPEQKAEIAALAQIPDGELDYSDITPQTEEELASKIIIGNPWVTPPTKTVFKQVLIDSDIAFWILRQVGEEGCREKMNAMLRQAMEMEREKRDIASAPA